MSEAPTILELPAGAGARLLALSWIDQLELRVERWRAPPPLDDDRHRSIADVREALGRLRACTRNYRLQLRGSVEKADRRRLRSLERVADSPLTLRREIDQLVPLVSALPPADRPHGEWMVDRLRQRLAKAEARFSRGVERDGRRLERNLARRLGSYTTEIRLGELTTDASFAAASADALRESVTALERALGDGMPPFAKAAAQLERIDRIAERAACIVEPVRDATPSGALVLLLLGELRTVAARVRTLHLIGATIVRALERESASQARAVGSLVLRGEGTFRSLRSALRSDRRTSLLLLAAAVARDLERGRAELARQWLGGHPADLFSKLRDVATLLDGIGAATGERSSPPPPAGPADS